MTAPLDLVVAILTRFVRLPVRVCRAELPHGDGGGRLRGADGRRPQLRAQLMRPDLRRRHALGGAARQPGAPDRTTSLAKALGFC